MKKSITLLALAIVSFATASNSKDSVSSLVKADLLSDSKTIVHADPSLIQSELGSLKKTVKSVDAIIADDLLVTEAVVPAKISLNLKKQAKKSQPVRLNKTLQN